LARLRKKEESKMRNNERGDITTYATETEKIVRGHDEQLDTNKSDNLEEMGKLLEVHDLSKPNHEEIECLN
jgi:hypothetical protein